MRILSPASRATIKIRFSLVDVGLAALSPLLALYACHALILASDSLLLIASYWAIALLSSLIAFVAFRIHEAIPRYLSVPDVMAVIKAVALGELLAGGVWFILTRLEGIPRSVPLVHALILGAGLLAVRALAHIGDLSRGWAGRPPSPAYQHVILIGLNKLSFVYMKLLKTSTATPHRVIAVLDDQPRWIGRSVDGVRVFGPPAQLEALIAEFAVHGVHTHGVVIGGRSDILSEEALNEVRRVCTRHGIELVFVPHVFGIGLTEADCSCALSSPAVCRDQIPANFALPRYFRCKRAIDFCAALMLLIPLLPVLLVVSVLSFADIGLPIFFWQQRTGLRARAFLLYKIRTLRPAFDWRGLPTPENLRLSWIGRFLRRTRLDELPQLLNVLVGDMSLIGPRPLLPEDQPPNRTVRLMVRPGITGWAQVNGGALLSPTEKGQLDEWYIRNASFALDLRILWLTALGLLRRNWGVEEALARAHAAPTARPDGKGSQKRQSAALRGVAAGHLDPAPDRQSRSSPVASV
ncbi:MAG TPA: sugar transferase [Stellaceae bacterium]|nr:sugar transferase [Stellaceae bacterium]